MAAQNIRPLAQHVEPAFYLTRNYPLVMRLAGLILVGLGLLCVVGSIGYAVYFMATALSAAHEVDAQAAGSGMSIGTTLSITTGGIVLIIAGIIVIAAATRSSGY